MENWKPISGYDGFYEVSDMGNVRALERSVIKSDGVIQRRTARECKKYIDDCGYVYVKLNRDAKTKIFKVHRLVYAAFIGDIPVGMEIDHIDFDRQNNRASNLQLLTHKENVRRTCDAGRHPSSNNNFVGANNPNYGNRALREKYRLCPHLSKEKQSRPGNRNGRARKTTLVFEDGSELSFDYIRQAAEYLRCNVGIDCKNETIASRLVEASRTCGEYRGIRVYIS